MISALKEGTYKIGGRPFFVYYIKKPSTRTEVDIIVKIIFQATGYINALLESRMEHKKYGQLLLLSFCNHNIWERWCEHIEKKRIEFEE